MLNQLIAKKKRQCSVIKYINTVDLEEFGKEQEIPVEHQENPENIQKYHNNIQNSTKISKAIDFIEE